MNKPIKVNFKVNGKPTSTTINYVLAYGLMLAKNKGNLSNIKITQDLIVKTLQDFVYDLIKNGSSIDKEGIEFEILHTIFYGEQTQLNIFTQN